MTELIAWMLDMRAAFVLYHSFSSGHLQSYPCCLQKLPRVNENTEIPDRAVTNRKIGTKKNELSVPRFKLEFIN